MLIEDPSAEKRSEMVAKPSLCNGKANGTPCKHYWLHVAKVESNNPDILRQGEFHRACLISPGFPVEFSEFEIPHTCNQYQRPGFRGLLDAIVKFFKKAKYTTLEETYNPITPEEYKISLEEAMEEDPSFLANLEKFKGSLPIIGQDIPEATESPEFLQDVSELFKNRSEAMKANEDK